MLIAVATDDGRHISAHFGRCAFFSIWQCLDDSPPHNLGVRVNTFTMHAMNNPGSIPDIPNAPSVGEVPGEPTVKIEPLLSLEEIKSTPKAHSHAGVLTGLADVQVLISAGMGRRAVNDLGAAGKEIFITSEQKIEDAVNQYVEGNLSAGEPCSGH
mgnify:CR=1 FL=1